MGVRAGRGEKLSQKGRNPPPGAVVRLSKESAGHLGIRGTNGRKMQRVEWLTLEEAQVLLADLTRVVCELVAERAAEREAARAQQ